MAPQKLTRSTSERMLAGVAGGLARHFDADPTLFRVGFAVLSLFGGAGIVLYLLLAVLVPADDAEADPLGGSKARAGLIIALVVVALIALPFGGPGLFFLWPFVLIGAIGVLLYRAAGGAPSPALWRASLIALTVIGAILLGLGGAIGVAFGGGPAVAGIVLGLGLVMILAALLVGSARWLIVPALVLAIPLAVVSAADLDLQGGVGEREYRPAAVSDIRDSYKLGVGELHVDLRDVDFPPGVTEVRADIGVGHIRVDLPDDVKVSSDVHVGAGDTRVLGRSSDGIDVEANYTERVDPEAPVVHIRADAGMGFIEVRRGDAVFLDGRRGLFHP